MNCMGILKINKCGIIIPHLKYLSSAHFYSFISLISDPKQFQGAFSMFRDYIGS